jgi:hypothetical protein
VVWTTLPSSASTASTNFLPLPQLVVCGDQSSRNSSVLEAMKEIPFPGKTVSVLGSTEIILHRALRIRLPALIFMPVLDKRFLARQLLTF